MNGIMTFNKLINARCTLQMLQCMTVHFYSLNVNQSGGDVARGKTYEKASVWHLYILINYGSIPPCIFVLIEKKFQMQILKQSTCFPGEISAVDKTHSFCTYQFYPPII